MTNYLCYGDGYEYYFIGCLLLIWLNSFIVGGILWEARWSSFKSVNTRTSRGEARKTADYGRRYTRTKANWKGHENFVPFPTVFFFPSSFLTSSLPCDDAVCGSRAAVPMLIHHSWGFERSCFLLRQESRFKVAGYQDSSHKFDTFSSAATHCCDKWP